MVVWELIWDSRGGGRSEGEIGVGATVNEEEGVWLSLRSANLDSGRNFMWFIQELLHLYKLTPAKILPLSLHAHIASRMSTPSVKRGKKKT